NRTTTRTVSFGQWRIARIIRIILSVIFSRHGARPRVKAQLKRFSRGILLWASQFVYTKNRNDRPANQLIRASGAAGRQAGGSGRSGTITPGTSAIAAASPAFSLEILVGVEEVNPQPTPSRVERGH